VSRSTLRESDQADINRPMVIYVQVAPRFRDVSRLSPRKRLIQRFSSHSATSTLAESRRHDRVNSAVTATPPDSVSVINFRFYARHVEESHGMMMLR